MLYEKLVRPVMFRVPPETAHRLSLQTLSVALANETARQRAQRFFDTDFAAQFGSIKRFGLEFKNPLGLAAGFDKNGKHSGALAALGFGFIETGTVTPQPQIGNPTPRLFRLPKDFALINRQGFNNNGARNLFENLKLDRPACVTGVNIGKNRATPNEEAVNDYVASFDAVYKVADYVALNVSSPNTPGLRELQRLDALNELLRAVQKRNRELATRNQLAPLPVLVKIAPDVTDSDLEMFVDVARRNALAGIIATNTTIARGNLTTSKSLVESYGAGGLSGKPLCARSTEIIRRLYLLAEDSLVIIGVGGVMNGHDALAKICAGASLVQLYTGFVYQGWNTARNINRSLIELLQGRGFRTFDEAVGSDAR